MTWRELGDAERYVKDVLDRGDRLMGFGHRVYRAEDPRARVLRRTARRLGSPRVEVAEALERAALAELAGAQARSRARNQRRVLVGGGARLRGCTACAVHPDVHLRANGRVVRSHPRAEARGAPDPTHGQIHRPWAATARGRRGLRAPEGRPDALGLRSDRVPRSEMRVLLVSWEYPPVIEGGLARHVRKLSEHLVDEGVEVHVLSRSGGHLPAEELRHGVVVHRVREPEFPKDVNAFVRWVDQMNADMYELGVGLCEQLDFDLVHSHDWLVADVAQRLAETHQLSLVGHRARDRVRPPPRMGRPATRSRISMPSSGIWSPRPIE